MRYLLLRNEKSVSDVADKAYKGLSAESRERAEAALLKANPELKTFKSIRKGFIVRVPTVRDGGENNPRNLIDPVEGITHELLVNLKLFENTLTRKFANYEDRQKNVIDTLKAANKDLKKQANGDAIAKALKKHVADTKKLNDKNKILGLEALQKLQKTAAATFEH